ncbi:MAG: glycoside hydrolase family 13 protein [Bacteroidota bacterium]
MQKYTLTLILGLLTLLLGCTPKVKPDPQALEKIETVTEEKEKESTEVEEKKEDPAMQKYPDGVEPPEYKRIAATGQSRVNDKRIEPPFWWVGMKNSRVELIIHDYRVRGYKAVTNHPDVRVIKVTNAPNPNYLFVELDISPRAAARPFKIALTKGEDVRTYDYEIKARRSDPRRVQGLDASDLIYLLMPDRFANGDPRNDSVEGMLQTGVARDKIFFRHGGDLQGIIDRLDYFSELGITALWLNPVQENDEAYESYHGYAVTDHYAVDPRFGSNELYLELVEKCHARGIKVIMDIIHNHVGDQHWFIKDLPSEDWIHQFDEYTKTTYRAPTLMDPYAAEADRQQMSDGWFDEHMPDLNQTNPHLARYLIQNNIWWVEYTGLDGYRIDTYAYPDQDFMADWGKAMQEEYPKLGLFGETWVHGAPIQAQFTQNNQLREGYNSYLPGVTDFQLYYAINEALGRQQGWTEGISKIYYTLAKDFLYEDPYRNVLFLDNHDLGRFFGVVEQDFNKYKSGLSLLMTLRGIPMIYYGTEILMTGTGGAFGEGGRKDFPGGWAGDAENKFEAAGRSAQEQEAFDFIKKLARYRKITPALQSGKMTQFVPVDDIYVFFRYDADRTVMVITNSAPEAKTVATQRYAERMRGFRSARDVITDEVISDLSAISVERNATRVLELIR